MEIKTSPFKLHYFVCERCTYMIDDELCPKDTAMDLRKRLKDMAMEHFPKAEVRINGSGCLGQCEHGIASILYPKGEFRTGLRPGDETKLIEWLKEEFKN
ncbi:MAG: (2Fe-2S) ferredoxin domain-containing protein [Deltaproteobacteria bacterium]|nr:MAG: (2Fe-2S) ferredoxin domain-containing protein [Deltaproteobacteria bacterium]